MKEGKRDFKAKYWYLAGFAALAVLFLTAGLTTLLRRPAPAVRQEEAYTRASAGLLIKADWPGAIRMAQEGLTQSPRCANLYFNLALAHYLSGDYLSARQALRSLTTLEPNYPDLHYLLGMIYYQNGEKRAAREEFIRELNANPDNRRAWWMLRNDSSAQDK